MPFLVEVSEEVLEGLTDPAVARLLAVFAERRPLPGACSAASLAAALGAALAFHVVRRGVRRGRTAGGTGPTRTPAEVEEILRRMVTEGPELAERDRRLMAAVRAAADGGEQEKALKEALAVPFEVLALVRDVLDSLAEMADEAHVNLVADLAAGAALLHAGAVAAAFAARGVASQLQDREHADGACEEVQLLEEAVRASHKKILDTADAALSC